MSICLIKIQTSVSVLCLALRSVMTHIEHIKLSSK